VISLICIYRWGIVGISCAFVGGIAACISAKSLDYVQYIAYGVGNLSIIFPVLLFQYKIGRKKISENKFIQISYVIVSFICVIFFRSLIISLFTIDQFFDTLILSLRAEIVLECMSLAISILIMLIAGRKNGNILVEMVSYVQEVHDRMKLGGLKEYKEQSNFNLDRPFTEEDEIDESNLLDGGTLNKEQLKELNELFANDVENEVATPKDNSKEK
jgi:hypothetical protein